MGSSITSAEAQRRLILLAVATSATRRDAGELGQALAALVDWPWLIEDLRVRRLLARLGPRVLELAGEHGNARFSAALAQALDAGRRQGAFLELTALRLIAMLGDRGIAASPLKGPLFSRRIYGDVGRRLSGDLDLLVAPAQLSRAVEVVRSLGYAAPSDHTYSDGLPLLHYSLLHERGELPCVELHWRVHWYERRFAQERLLAPSNAQAAEWRPAPADELAALLLFYARDGFIDLRLACDLSAWWDANGANLPRGALDEVVDRYPQLGAAIRAGARAGERVLGLPTELILAGAESRRVRERIAVRLANPHPDLSAAQAYADMGLIDGLLSPPGGLGAFARRQLLLEPELRRQQARHGGRNRARPRLVRLLAMLARYARSMSRLVRGRPDHARCLERAAPRDCAAAR